MKNKIGIVPEDFLKKLDDDVDNEDEENEEEENEEADTVEDKGEEKHQGEGSKLKIMDI